MTKPIKESKLLDYPLEDEQMFGRNYIERMYYATGNRSMEHEMAQIWERMFTNIALSCVKWNNMPDSIDARAVEFILLNYGCGALFVDGGPLFAQASGNNMLNMYWNPNRVFLVSPNGEKWERWADAWVKDGEIMSPDCAVCWDNMQRLPLRTVIRAYSRRIAHCDAVIDTNIEAQKTPWITAAPPEQKRNARRWQQRLETNDQYIPVNDDSTLPFTLDTKAPYVANDIKVTQNTLVNECLTFLGVDNSTTDKKERVQTAEVLSNNEQVNLMRESRMKCRRQFAERANKLFGLKLEPEWAVEGVWADIAAALQGGGLNGLQMAMANGNGGNDNE